MPECFLEIPGWPSQRHADSLSRIVARHKAFHARWRNGSIVDTQPARPGVRYARRSPASDARTGSSNQTWASSRKPQRAVRPSTIR
jgi:hypothetical protein